jgi:hypothetical protein
MQFIPKLERRLNAILGTATSRFRVDVARAGNSSMAIRDMAIHLKVNQRGETFFISSKAPQPNQESLYPHHAKRMTRLLQLLSKMLPDRGDHCAQRI